MTKVTIAPITSTIKGLSSEVLLGPANGLDRECAISADNILTVRQDTLGRTIGYLTEPQEKQLAQAIIFAFNLRAPLAR